AVASSAVARHDTAALGALDPSLAHGLVSSSLAGGFHAAVACAGLAGLLAAGLLLGVRPRTAALPARA
ncbi:hypothetical protein APR50_42920, partial [Variovorax paradoxus]